MNSHRLRLAWLFVVTCFLSSCATIGPEDDFSEDDIGTWGFIDKHGAFVIPPKFNSSGTFHNGFASVNYARNPSQEVTPQECVINRQGQLISPRLFAYVGQMNEGLLPIRKPIRLLPEDGKRKDWPEDLKANATYIRPDGTTLDFKFCDCHDFISGVAVVAVGGLSDSSYRIIDKNLIITAQFSGHPLEPGFSDGLLPVLDGNNFVYVDKKGKVAIPERFSFGGGFSEGLAAVRSNDLWGVIDTTGKFVIAPKYSGIGVFHNGVAVARDERDRHMILDRNGSILCSFKDSIIQQSNGWFQLRKGSKSVFVDKHGQKMLEIECELADDFREGLCPVEVRRNNKHLFGFIDEHGTWVIPPSFDGASTFSEGLAAVRVQNHHQQQSWPFSRHRKIYTI